MCARFNLLVMIPAEANSRLRHWRHGCAVLVLLFAWPIFEIARFALSDGLASYILIVPAVSGWLVWQERGAMDWEFVAAPRLSLVFAALALGLAASPWIVPGDTASHSRVALSLWALAFVAGLTAVTGWILGTKILRQVGFPLGFLVFLAPLPPPMIHTLEVGLQHASAEVSDWFFAWTGASVFRQGLVFQLPNITLEVAPECSGLRSTLVLVMTSLIAGHLFLKRTWQRTLFTVLVIPLGIARNAFRILTIGWLCIEYGPAMIDSPIHHRGGPLFFGLSLLPLFALLYFFRRMEAPPKAVGNPPAKV